MRLLYRGLLLGGAAVLVVAVVVGSLRTGSVWAGLLVGLLAGGIVLVLIGGTLSVLAALVGEARTVIRRTRARPARPGPPSA